MFAQCLVKPDLVMRPDAFAQIVEQLDHSERLCGRPIVWEDERDTALSAGRQERRLHDLALRRSLARCSERSLASFKR